MQKEMLMIEFGRMWGVMETLGELPNYQEEMIDKTILKWIEEYYTNSDECESKEKFFQDKMKKIRRESDYELHESL